MLGSLLIASNFPNPHLEGTLLPRGFFLGLGLIYLVALAVDRLAAKLRLPGAVAVLLLGLILPTAWLDQSQLLDSVHEETIHRVSLALLIFYAGLRTDLRRIRGMVLVGLRLGIAGVFTMLATTAIALFILAPLLFTDLPPAAALLAVCCLGATDSGAIEDLLVAVGHPIRGRLTHLLQFEAAVSTVVTLLVFGLVAGVLQATPHNEQQALHGLLASRLLDQLSAVGLHVVAGLVAGLVVGGVAPRLVDVLVRSEPMLLVVAISLAFMAFGFGQILGGGGLLAVFVAGAFLSNGRYRIRRFDQQAVSRVMHPLNTTAELTVLLLLGLLVKPAALFSALPLGLVLALVVPAARTLAVNLMLPSKCFLWPDRLVVAGFGLRGAVPLALAVSMTEELPHLTGVAATLAEPLGQQLLALLFVVILIDLLLQPVLMRHLKLLNQAR